MRHHQAWTFPVALSSCVCPSKHHCPGAGARIDSLRVMKPSPSYAVAISVATCVLYVAGAVFTVRFRLDSSVSSLSIWFTSWFLFRHSCMFHAKFYRPLLRGTGWGYPVSRPALLQIDRSINVPPAPSTFLPSLSHAVQQETPVLLLQFPPDCHDGDRSLDGRRGVTLPRRFLSNLCQRAASESRSARDRKTIQTHKSADRHRAVGAFDNPTSMPSAPSKKNDRPNFEGSSSRHNNQDRG